MSVLAARGKPIGDATITFLNQEKDSLLKTMTFDYLFRGGKHLRSVLCITSCEAFGGKAKVGMNVHFYNQLGFG